MSRRKFIAYGVGVSAFLGISKWKTPIVNAVMLPAHAQTSASCSALKSPLFSVTTKQGLDFQLSNNCITSVSDSFSESADIIIEFKPTPIKGTVAAADFVMNYSGKTKFLSFLPDDQSKNQPFILPLDDYELSTGEKFSISLELNYSQSKGLEVSVLINPI